MNLLIDSQSAAISHSALSGSAVNVRKVYGRVGPYTFRGCRTNALNECTLNTDSWSNANVSTIVSAVVLSS
eukprot:2030959-Pyramimonas_sp.AAC.1